VTEPGAFGFGNNYEQEVAADVPEDNSTGAAEQESREPAPTRNIPLSM